MIFGLLFNRKINVELGIMVEFWYFMILEIFFFVKEDLGWLIFFFVWENK